MADMPPRSTPDPAEVQLVRQTDLETLAEVDDDERVVSGIGIKYGVRFERWADEFWSLEAGCFGALGDVAMLRDHDWGKILGRTIADTLKLEDTPEALRYKCLLGDCPDGHNAYVSVDRGDIDGASIGFRITRHEWIDNEDGSFDFIVKEAELREVSLTPIPVFEESTAGTGEAFRRTALVPAPRPPVYPPHVARGVDA